MTTRQLVNETAQAVSGLLLLLNGCNDEKVDAILDQAEVARVWHLSKLILRQAQDKSEEIGRKQYPLSEYRMNRIEAQDEN